jgi:hypothetical protein
LAVVRRAVEEPVEEPVAEPELAAGRCCGAGAGGTETTFLFPHELARTHAMVAALAMAGIFRFIMCPLSRYAQDGRAVSRPADRANEICFPLWRRASALFALYERTFFSAHSLDVTSLSAGCEGSAKCALDSRESSAGKCFHAPLEP